MGAEDEAVAHHRALDPILFDQPEYQIGAAACRVHETLGDLVAELTCEMLRRMLEIRHDLTEAPAGLAPTDVPRFEHEGMDPTLRKVQRRGHPGVASADNHDVRVTIAVELLGGWRGWCVTVDG